jgi:hypothetical protein
MLSLPALACYCEENCGRGRIIYAYCYEGGCISNCTCYCGGGQVGYTYWDSCANMFRSETLDCGLIE